MSFGSLLWRVLDITVHPDHALAYLLPFRSHEILNGLVLSVIGDFLDMSVTLEENSP